MKTSVVLALSRFGRSKSSAPRAGVSPPQYWSLVESGKVRHFAIESNLEAFWQVLTLREAVIDAGSNQLTVAGKNLTKQQLFDLVDETKVLEGLKFFEYIRNDWEKPSQQVAAEPSSDDTTRPAGPQDPLEAQMAALVDFLKRKRQPVIADGIQAGPTFVRSVFDSRRMRTWPGFKNSRRTCRRTSGSKMNRSSTITRATSALTPNARIVKR